MSLAVDTLIVGARVATMGVAADFGLVDGAVIGLRGDEIAYLGSPDTGIEAVNVVEAAGRLVTPALLDCHTHLVFAGERIGDFERRLSGSTYAEIAAGGGGIRSTVAATREATEDELFELARVRVGWLLASGVGTIEIKSGYGLDIETELRILRVARRLDAEMPATVRTSLLGAHAVPAEFADDPDRYVDLICNEMIPAAAAEGLADSVDAFCESIAFSRQQVRRVFAAAREVACRYASMPTNYPTSAAPALPPSIRLCLPTISSMPRAKVWPRWRRPARSPW